MIATTEPDLAHKILSLLKRGPYMRQEIARYCRPATSEQVDHALLALERSGMVRYLAAVGLFQVTAL